MEEILYWVAGFVGVPLVNALKTRLGAEGKAAMWLTAAVAAALAAVAVLFAEARQWGEWTPETLFAAFGQVLAAATLAYKLLGDNES